MQAISELDDEHPDVFGHRDQQLADRCRLLLFLRVELEAIDLGATIDNGSDIGPKLGFDFAEAHIGVFDRIVHDCGSNRRGIEALFCHDRGHLDGVQDVGFA